jgi:hypothetical protein
VSGVRSKGAAPPNPITRAVSMLREAGTALRDVIQPPLRRVQPLKPVSVPGLRGVTVSAKPVSARGAQITWRVTVERGGSTAGVFETRLTRLQLEESKNFLAPTSPLRRQVVDVLRAPQKRLQELGSRVERRNAPEGANLQATIVAKQEYRNGAWRHVGYAVGEVRRYTWDPVHAGQKREALGYHRTTIGRGETIRMTDGSQPKTLKEAQARVAKMLEYRGLTPVSASGVRAAAEIRDTQRDALQDLSARIGARARPGAGSWTGVQLRPWTSPVAMPGKAFREWTPVDRVGYTVEVARQHLPGELGRQLKELMTPQTVQALAALGLANMVGAGVYAEAALLGLSAPGMVEGTRAFGRYLQTTMQAKHPMELVTAGRELSEIAAPLVVDGGAMLGAFGVTRAVRLLKPPAPPPPAPPPAALSKPVLAANIPSKQRRFEYAQQQHWPQQSQRRRDAAPDPGGSQSDARVFMNAMAQARAAKRQPMHLSLQNTASGEVRVAVDRSQLEPSAQAADDRLEKQIGAAQLQRMLGVLIAGDGKEVGLHSLADAWRTLQPEKPLSGRTLVGFGQVLSGRDDFGTLDDLAGLSEHQAGSYRGIVPFTDPHTQVRSWISAHGNGASVFGLDYMDDLPTEPPSVDALRRSPWLLQHLRNLQNAYDQAVREALDRDRSLPDQLPWPSSQVPGFVDSAAAAHAFWATLRSAGPTESVMPTLKTGQTLSWDEAADAAATQLNSFTPTGDAIATRTIGHAARKPEARKGGQS